MSEWQLLAEGGDQEELCCLKVAGDYKVIGPAGTGARPVGCEPSRAATTSIDPSGDGITRFNKMGGAAALELRWHRVA